MAQEIKIENFPDIAIFLGAGASYPLDYPTTREFIDHLQESLKNNNKNEEANLLHYILTNIKEIQDVEEVLELLEALEEQYTTHPSNRFYKNFRTLIHLGGTAYELDHVIRWIKSLREEVEKEVFETYRWNPEIKNKATQLYEPLLNLVYHRLHRNVNQLLIFTTNYERVIEEVGNAFDEYEVIDGFGITKGGKNVWNPVQEFNKNSSNDMCLIKLFKLHGSLNWRESTEEILEKVGTEERTLGNSAHKRNILIYPTLTHKQNHAVEYLNMLYETFRSSMKSIACCIVIGYSFRDQNINDVFVDFIQRKGTTLIAISPSAEKNVRRNLLQEKVPENEKLGEVSERRSRNAGNLIMINGKFEEEQTFVKLSGFVDSLKLPAV